MAKLFYSAIDLKQNQLQRAVIHNIEEPANPVKGQIYYDTGDDILKYYADSNSGEWISVTANTNTQDDTDLGETPAVGSYTITSSTGADLSMTAADSTNWGIMTDDHVGAIDLNTDKLTNVTTDLGITGSTGARTITSSDGTDAVIPIATTSVSGLMTPGMFDDNALISGKANIASPTFTGTVTTAGLMTMTSGVSAEPLFKIYNSNADNKGGTIRFEKNGATPATGDVIGTVL